jgi:hypothetical protein
MADFAPQLFFKFHKKYENVMSEMNREAVPKHIVSQIKGYFDYVWAHNKGINYEKVLNNLPSCLKTDILSARYAEATKNSLIFKDDNDEIDYPLTNSILSKVKFRIYMDGDLIVKGGSYSSNTYIFLDGEGVIFALNEEFIAYIKSGGHYSNNLEEGDENKFEYKRPIHIISKGISIIGIINLESLEELYDAYPYFKTKFQMINTQFALYIRKFLKFLNLNKEELSINRIIQSIADHYTYSTSLVYDSLREK